MGLWPHWGGGADLALRLFDVAKGTATALDSARQAGVMEAAPAGGASGLGVGRNGPVAITETPAILERKDSPFRDADASNVKEWRSVWKKWLAGHRAEWRGDQPVVVDEGEILMSGTTENHIRNYSPLESPELHFEAAARLRDLLENSKLVFREAPREYDRHSIQVQKRYAWMVFDDVQVRHVLLNVKLWKDPKAKATAYHVETLDVMEPSGEFRPWTSGFPKADQSQDGSGTMLAWFLSGIKPEHRWTGPDAGSFSLGAYRSRLRQQLDRADAPPEYRRRAVEVARKRLVEIERRHRARVAAEGVGRAEALGMFLERMNAEADKRRPDSRQPPSSSPFSAPARG